MARALERVNLGASLTSTVDTFNSSISAPKLCSAFAIAEFKTFFTIPALFCGEKVSILIASSTLFPRIASADAIRGKSVDEAIKILTFSPQKSAGIVKKVLNSAIANAEHNLGADIDELKVSTVEVNEAPRFTRSRARAKGRGERIIKRNSHITIRVGDE